jgi:hypothetical protein
MTQCRSVGPIGFRGAQAGATDETPLRFTTISAFFKVMFSALARASISCDLFILDYYARIDGKIPNYMI